MPKDLPLQWTSRVWGITGWCSRLQENNPSFFGEFRGIYLKLIKEKTWRMSTCNWSWTWKHLDLHRLCPKISPYTGMWDVASSRTSAHGIEVPHFESSGFWTIWNCYSPSTVSSQFLRPVNSVCVNRTFDKKWRRYIQEYRLSRASHGNRDPRTARNQTCQSRISSFNYVKDDK